MTNWSTRVQHEGRRPEEGSDGGQASEGAPVPCLSGRLATPALNRDAGAKMRGVKQGPKQVNGAKSVNKLLPSQRAAAHTATAGAAHAYGNRSPTSIVPVAK